MLFLKLITNEKYTVHIGPNSNIFKGYKPYKLTIN